MLFRGLWFLKYRNFNEWNSFIIIFLKYPGVFKYKNLNTKKYFTKVTLNLALNPAQVRERP